MHNEPFSAVFETFLESVAQKNYKIFCAFFLKREPFRFISANGDEITDAYEFIENHRSWFESEAGYFKYTILDIHSTGELGVGTLRAEFKHEDNHQNAIHFDLYISCMFKRLENQWILIHDQNTLLKDHST